MIAKTYTQDVENELVALYELGMGLQCVFPELEHNNPEEDNRIRAVRAEAAAVLCAGMTGLNTNYDKEECIIDLIADLLHLAKVCGFDPEKIIETARTHFDDEQTDCS